MPVHFISYKLVSSVKYQGHSDFQLLRDGEAFVTLVLGVMLVQRGMLIQDYGGEN